VRTFLAKARDQIIPFVTKGLLGSFISAFILALTNPMTIFAFLAVFAAFGLGHQITAISALYLVLGIFGGSLLWFLTLGFVATFFRKKLNRGGLRWVNRVAGVLLILSGVAAFVSLL
jgi:threonine/homoserine/homoserine lactone efflux protein